ncbi:MAG: hypothetical protein ACHREM_25660 [Polyangiales bacterium]
MPDLTLIARSANRSSDPRVLRWAIAIAGALLIVGGTWSRALFADARVIWALGHDRSERLFPAHGVYDAPITEAIADPDDKNAFRHCFGACVASAVHGRFVTTSGGRMREYAIDWREAPWPSPDTRADLCNNDVGATWDGEFAKRGERTMSAASAPCEARCASATSVLVDPDDAAMRGALCRRPKSGDAALARGR